MENEFYAGVGMLMVIAMFFFGIILLVAAILMPLFVWGIYSRMGKQNRDMESALRELRGLRKQLETDGLAKPTPKIPAKKPASARSASLPPIKTPESVRDMEMDQPFDLDEEDEEEGFECESCSFIGTVTDFTTAEGLACPNCGQN